jgi:hypothetical protein
MLRFWMTVIFFLPQAMQSQRDCLGRIRVEGSVVDTSGAVIPGARITSPGQSITADRAGQFILTCLVPGTPLQAIAPGFAMASAHADGAAGTTVHLALQLSVADVASTVQVDAETATLDDTNGSGTVTLSRKEIDQLPDDPDDLLAQLQLMAASGGGNPTTDTVIVIDGFQNGSAMPPKSAIASIRINPDVFASEYESPQIHGGRVEITTKPGADAFHGAVFYTDSNPVFNARDPLSTAATPAGKHRYGFELTGPLGHGKADFSTAFEKRDIDEFKIVNAITLDSNFNPIPFHQTVAAPQHLWIASLRGDWQTTQQNNTSLAFASNVNSLGNQGVGGLVLAESGYSNFMSEYDLRFHNTQTINPNLLHETRIGYTWKRTQDAPNSTAPSVQVAGYFTAGGALTQALNTRERDLEIDDSLLLTRSSHAVKVGVQSLGIFEHNYDPNGFNGAFVFGGGSAPVLDGSNNPTGATTTITAAQQYQRALSSFPGGNPTTYQLTTGDPLVSFTQWNIGLFAQDSYKLNGNTLLDGGVRYQLQTNPSSYGDMQARLGLSISPDRKKAWIVHLRAGLFSSATTISLLTDVARLGQGRQQQQLIYSPSYFSPLTPIAGSIAIGTSYGFWPQFHTSSYFQTRAAVEHEFAHHWHWTFDHNWTTEWNLERLININAPEIGTSIGAPPNPTAALAAPRPFAPNENIYQYQNYGHARGWWFASTLDQHDFKWLSSKATYWYVSFQQNSTTPQSTYLIQGDTARPDWMARSGLSVNEVLTFPHQVVFSSYFDWLPGIPFNITTGTDGNGDGTFNDRPSFAAASGVGVYSTPFGLLTTNTVNGNVPYNLGRMPQIIHANADFSKVFALKVAKESSSRAITLNARAANLLNHTAVRTVGTVVSSPNFGQPLTAGSGRRVEFGARFSF